MELINALIFGVVVVFFIVLIPAIVIEIIAVLGWFTMGVKKVIEILANIPKKINK